MNGSHRRRRNAHNQTNSGGTQHEQQKTGTPHHATSGKIQPDSKGTIWQPQTAKSNQLPPQQSPHLGHITPTLPSNGMSMQRRGKMLRLYDPQRHNSWYAMHRNATSTHHSNANLPPRILHSHLNSLWHLKRVVRREKATTRGKTTAHGSRTRKQSSTHSMRSTQRCHHQGHGPTRFQCSLHHRYVPPTHLSHMLHVRG